MEINTGTKDIITKKAIGLCLLNSHSKSLYRKRILGTHINITIFCTYCIGSDHHTLASDTGRKTKDGKKITNFIECVAWRAQAEFVCKYLSKGRLVLVEGELTSRSYEDKDGNRRKAVEITVDSVHFCDSKKDGGQSSGSDFADPGYSEGSGDFTEIEDNGDLPF